VFLFPSVGHTLQSFPPFKCTDFKKCIRELWLILYLLVYHGVIFTVTLYHAQSDCTLIAPVTSGGLHATTTAHLTTYFLFPLVGEWWACKKLILLTLIPAGLGLPTTKEKGQLEHFSASSIKLLIKRTQKSQGQHWAPHEGNRIQPFIILRSRKFKKKKNVSSSTLKNFESLDRCGHFNTL
jgi:hypothetical protein